VYQALVTVFLRKVSQNAEKFKTGAITGGIAITLWSVLWPQIATVAVAENSLKYT
jgi:precorrin-6B methylase 2